MVIPMRSDTLLSPRVVDTSHDQGTSVYGGVVAYWTEEAGTKTVKEPTFGQLKLIAKKLTGYTYASDELLADSAIGLEALLTRMFGDALAWYEDEAFIEGSGVGEPLGFMNCGCYGTTSTRATASSVVLADLAQMWSDLLPQSHGRSVWLANPEVIVSLVQMASTTLTWMSLDQGVAKKPPATLIGRPIYFSEKMPALGTAGDICLVDLSHYVIGDRQKLTIASSPHIRFLTDETAWRFVQRVDGQCMEDSAFTPKYGGDLYPFVGLGT
jgi:HK97 family phage major capsid protein